MSSRAHSVTVLGVGSKETIIWRLQVQSWLQVSNNTGILNTCTRLWLTESEEATHCGFTKGRCSMFREGSRVRETPEEGWRTNWPNVVEITIKMKTIVRKLLIMNCCYLLSIASSSSQYLLLLNGHLSE